MENLHGLLPLLILLIVGLILGFEEKVRDWTKQHKV